MGCLTYKEKDFYLDGKKIVILSGTIHYFRVPEEYWYDRLLKLKACGLNTVETYTCWNLHERKEGQFDFTGMLNIAKFIKTAQDLGLYVILRPGPYICAEWDWGGMPSWLLKYPDMKRRCYDEAFIEKLRRYYAELFKQVSPYLSNHGGNILMVQVENEYGSYGNDKRYLQTIADLYKECDVGCLLFTSDGPDTMMLTGGVLENTMATVNFGSRPEEGFAALSRVRPHQPVMCTEFWCGWFDHWYEEHHVRPAQEMMDVYKKMIDLGASVNIYMFHGGTNFAFYNGANYDKVYQPTVTSYDYNAPLTEAGDLTPKYFEIKKMISDKFGKTEEIEVHNTPKKAYGAVKLTQSASLFEALEHLSKPVFNAAPLTMEEIDQDFGYILYRSIFKGPVGKQSLVLEGVHDRAHVFVNGQYQGIVERTRRYDDMKIELGDHEQVQVDILVENMGRVNYGPKLTGERKGITGSIRLSYQNQFGWEMYALPMDDLTGIQYHNACRDSKNIPSFFRGELEIEGKPCDTFIKTEGLQKGFIVVNGRNLGRYWNVSPTKTLYVPAPFLREGKNEIIVFESDEAQNASLIFQDHDEL